MPQDTKRPVDDDGTWGTDPMAPDYLGPHLPPAETLVQTHGTTVAPRDAGQATAGLIGSTGGGAAETGSSGGSEIGASSEFDAVARVVLEPGRAICDGKFHLMEKIGGGAMGDVWKVRHTELGRISVLKVIKREIAANRTARKRFWREGQLMAKLDHPNAVRVFDLGFKDGLAYMEMELVKGQSLDKLLKEGKDARPMSLEWTAQILEQLCSVLQEAHTFRDEDGSLRPIVHRDLKPSNLMLVDGKPPGQNLKVLDFGIAKMTEATKMGNSEDASLATQGFVGTPAYSSPEQINNEPVDGRSDLYAVGVFLFQVLTGSLPFKGGGMAVFMMHVHKEPPAMAEVNPDVKVPPAVEAVVRRCLAKAPGDRPQSAEELARLFREAAAPYLGQKSAPAIGVPVPVRRFPAAAVGAAVLGIAAIAGLATLIIPKIGGRGGATPTTTSNVPSTPIPTATVKTPDLTKPAAPIPTTPPVPERTFAGYVAVDRGQAPGGPRGLARKADGVRFFRLKTGAYLPEGYEPEDADLNDLRGAYPRVIVRKADGVDRKEWVRFIRIPGQTYSQGDFTLADPDLPPHNVKVASFYIQETEVTNGEFAEFVNTTPGLKEDSNVARWALAKDELVKQGQADSQSVMKIPAVMVSQELARKYARHVGGRLPTEAEWEFAARSGGALNRWSWGNMQPGVNDVFANTNGAAIFPAPVLSYKKDRTDYGVSDMTGNVREWCLDAFASSLGTPESAIRGGSYQTDLAEAMTYQRAGLSPKEGAQDVGFRVVIECPPDPAE